MPKFKADVTHMTARSDGTDPFDTVALEADTDIACAKRVGQLAAARKYGAHGVCTMMTTTPTPLQFRGFIGVSNGRGVTTGVTIFVRLRPVI